MKPKIIFFTIFAVSFFLAGVFVTKFYFDGQLKTSKSFNQRVIDSSVDALNLNKKLNDNLQNAFTLLANCVITKPQDCNFADTTQELNKLETERIDLYNQVNEATKKIDQLIADTKDWLGK